MKTKRRVMKLVLSLLAIGSTLTFIAFCLADESKPGTPSKPVVQSEAQPISELPFKITESGSYYLTQNLTHTDRYTNAIEVDANNVTIDLGGYSLIGPTTSYNETCCGIFMDMHSNVEIRNGTITNFPYRGIFSDNSGGTLGSTGIRIISVRVTSIGAEGIFLNGFHHTVRNCTVTNTQLDIQRGAGGITCHSLSSVTGNVVARHNIVGIASGSNCTIRDNTISECSYGIIPGDGCSIIDNTVSFVTDGIWILDSAGCLVRGNTLRECQGNGIGIEGMDNDIEANLVTSCEVGFNFVYDQNVYANNRALYNGTNFGGQVPTGIYDGGGNIGAGTIVGANVRAKPQLQLKARIVEKSDKKIGGYGLTSLRESQ